MNVTVIAKRLATIYRDSSLDELKKAVEIVSKVLRMDYNELYVNVFYELAE